MDFLQLELVKNMKLWHRRSFLLLIQCLLTLVGNLFHLKLHFIWTFPKFRWEKGRFVHCMYICILNVFFFPDLKKKKQATVKKSCNKGILHHNSIAAWDPKLQTRSVCSTRAWLRVLLQQQQQIWRSSAVCVFVTERVAKQISLTFRLFHRCGADCLPAPLMLEFLDSMSVYLYWLTMEAAEG